MNPEELLTNGYPDGRNYLPALVESAYNVRVRLASRWPYRDEDYREHQLMQREVNALWNHLTLTEKEYWMSEPSLKSWESTPGI